MHMRTIRLTALLGIGAIAGCDSPVESRNPPPHLSLGPFVISSPVPALPASSSPVRRSSGQPVVYVSLPPDSIPGGVAAIITNRNNGGSIEVPVQDGGFDPVSIPANRGDTIAVHVQVINGRVVTSFVFLVPAHAPPIVIRTSPPPHKRDVPLNARIFVIFSEPMDSTSLSGSLTLRENGNPISGTVIIPPNGGDILQAEFLPDVPLAPLITYQLDVGTSALDRSGNPLAAPAQSDFTTDALPADTVAPVITILSPAAGATMAVEYPSLEVLVQEDRDLITFDYMRLDEHGGLPQSFWEAFGSSLHDYIGTNWHYFDLPPGAGPRTIMLRAEDVSGNVGVSAPLAVTLVDPAPGGPIAVQAFSVVEYQYPGGQYWFYAPQLIVADTAGNGGFQIVGFEMISIPGLTPPFPRTWARSLAVPAGQGSALFAELYGDYELAFFAADGHRGTGVEAVVRLTYRDGSGHYFVRTIHGPIVPGQLPGTYSGGCGHWVSGISPADLSYCGWSGAAARNGRINPRAVPLKIMVQP